MACCIVEEDLVYIEPFCWISLSQELTSPPKDLCTVHSGNRCSTLNPYLKWSTKLDNSPHSSLFLHTLLNLLKDDHHHQQLLPCQSFSAPSRDLDSGDPDLWSMMPLPLFLPSQNQSRKLGHLCSWCWPLEDHHGQILPGGRSAQVPTAIFPNVPFWSKSVTYKGQASERYSVATQNHPPGSRLKPRIRGDSLRWAQK